jgi:hypothetical protein
MDCLTLSLREVIIHPGLPIDIHITHNFLMSNTTPSTLLLPVFIGGQLTYRGPPKFSSWWNIFNTKSGLLSTASDSLQWSSGIKDLLDAELDILRVNSQPKPDLETISQALQRAQEEYYYHFK